jgi:hypothetical protein
LPPLDSHQDNPNKYLEYVKRALYYNATGRTVKGLAGGIFQKTPSVEVEGPAKDQIQDITLAGQTIEMFALNMTEEYLVTGRYGILIDMASEEATEPRPYWVGYKAEDIINWRFANLGGDKELVFVVLREFVEEVDPNDEFITKPVEQYRVLRLIGSIYSQQIYREVPATPGSTEKKWIGAAPIIPLRRGTPLDFIPFALPWVVGQPPLLDLVDVNLSHYRGNADLKHGLHFTALPTPWVSGEAAAQTNAKKLHIGSGTAWALGKDGQAGMLEFTGKGLGAIRQDLQDMQKIMATLGARLLEEAPRYTETATAVSMRHSGDYATLRTLGQIVEQQLTWALKVHTWWLGTSNLVTDEKSNVELNKIFYDQTLTADELRALLLALQSNSISYKTFYARLSNAGWMREGISDEEELKDIEDQPEMIGVAPAQTEAAMLSGLKPKKPTGTDERLTSTKPATAPAGSKT